MSLLPLLFDESLFAPRRCEPPQRTWVGILDDDLYRPVARQHQDYLRNLNAALQDSLGANVSLDKNKFQANFDVQHFKPEEISVKLNDNVVTIEGKHEEKPDEHGHIFRHFVRKYTLPKDCDVSRLESKLSSDGVLSLSAPRTCGDKPSEISIPIIKTGQTANSIDQKQGKKK
ncbi:unnamed protein product [Acanthoscelides obtectus]|uniref:SHSP domain-containing protein n=1 Tax=Acanthoscelides obtectus TaxID=200917 RepID=A0A9P0PK59_ACAOB|nr:unnamed protein product [Acanthoscelides obtectus]CAK1651139.1 Alpha-crystallin B chain [Acanthoscelides obtectus]